MELCWGEVDGVRVVWGDVPGPLTAMLAFRVGRADEVLSRSGIGHVAAHLVLHRFGEDPDDRCRIDQTRTTFYEGGADDAEVVGFLGRLCERIGEMPVERLEAEKRIVRAERRGVVGPIEGMLAQRRYGAAGYGLVGWPEYGVQAISEADLAAWRARFLTAENAVLALSKEPPAGLRLPLPAGGEPQVPPEPTGITPPGRNWFTGEVGGVVVGAVVPRGAASAVTAALLRRRLWLVLREQHGVSQEPQVSYVGRDGGTAELTMLADCPMEHLDEARDRLVEVLDDMATTPPTGVELTEAKARVLDGAGEAVGLWAAVATAAFDSLAGRTPVGPGEWAAQVDAVRAEEVPPVLAAALDTGLAIVPPGAEMPSRWARLPTSSPAGVPGRAHTWTPKQVAGRLAPRLTVGAAGVSAITDAGRGTVRYGSCAAALAWPDGRRFLVDDDGSALDVEPNQWSSAKAIVTAIDAGVPPERLVPMPERRPQDIPKRGRRHVPTRLLVANVVAFGALMALLVTRRDLFEANVAGGLAMLAYGVGGFSLITLLGRSFQWLDHHRATRTADRP